MFDLDALFTEPAILAAWNAEAATELDAVLAATEARLRRLHAEDKLDEATLAIIEAECKARAYEIGLRFGLAYLDAALDAEVTIDEARNG
jgi:hypothetical protein